MNNCVFPPSSMDTFKGIKRISFSLMKHSFLVFMLFQVSGGMALAATTLVVGTEYNFAGTSFSYSKVRFDSATWESGASVSVNGDSLSMGFTGFSAAALTSTGFNSDYGRVHFGLRLQANPSVSIDQLTLSAGGTYQVSANTTDSWAAVLGSIPFSMQILGVNGTPYSGADLSRSFALSLNPASVTIQYGSGAVDQNGASISSSGSWVAQRSLANLAGLFSLGTNDDITELDVAITPHFSTANVDGISTVITDQITVTPTPEPGSLSLVGIAGLAFLAARRRRRS